MRITPEKITEVSDNEIFVFGSNESARHGAGAAKVALAFGADFNTCFGFAGNTFAIPTKDWEIKTLPLSVIRHYVDRFLAVVPLYPELTFLVTALGTGLAGYTVADIAPLFEEAITMENVHLPETFWNYLKQK
jgi:hypothetical protein